MHGPAKLLTPRAVHVHGTGAYWCAGVRSVNFVDTLLTIGTGAGAIYFFDRRVNKYLEMNCGHPCSLNVGPGWLVRISVKLASLFTVLMLQHSCSLCLLCFHI